MRVKNLLYNYVFVFDAYVHYRVVHTVILYREDDCKGYIIDQTFQKKTFVISIINFWLSNLWINKKRNSK